MWLEIMAGFQIVAISNFIEEFYSIQFIYKMKVLLMIQAVLHIEIFQFLHPFYKAVTDILWSSFILKHLLQERPKI